MSIPVDCTVLVVGDGPYHIGESLLLTTRHYLDLIDLTPDFEDHGFMHKNGAAFRFNNTDFLAAGGPKNHSWNVIRSEADNIIFQHAGKSGAKVFDGVKVHSLHFISYGDQEASDINPGKPISASWSAKDGTTGIIRFGYLVDASGRAGLVSTKYLKNRSFNPGLKNVTSWGYFRNAGRYGAGTCAEGAPYFHVLEDGMGWAWFIPLHNRTTSVGVVTQQSCVASKKAMIGSPSSKDFFLANVKDVTGLHDLLGHAELVSDVKSASDWSYSASSYASPYIHIVGDAVGGGGGLSAAVTICASLKGQCGEASAANWHSQKIREAYTRFLLAVGSSYNQMMGKERPVLSEIDEHNFDRAFDIFRPIIQGTVEIGGKLSQQELAESVKFCIHVIQKMDETKESHVKVDLDRPTIGRSPVMAKIITANGTQSPEAFQSDVIDGMAADVSRSNLGLVHVEKQ
ncbi:FAD/NAD(P)-binding domain-containing protein [Penicillium longicatenatum]|uniref:FAD/NAD(P)-binding domain-containing protein n=1 Tax=Penicillium longicatenatum TaxID=1561947 RepID=UPI002546D46E|nr:FAD/NAD(P)-binding domain-containing protein [Penicillium longicatenatum]KAJ5643189.1 FAD/NAD(P)-binding domain-containing protein [Penicillium longicatenatum]